MDKASPKILIADGNPEFREMIKNWLKVEGYTELNVTENGKAAWDRLKTTAVDLLISADDLPGLNGFDLLAAIRKDRSLKDTPFLMMAAEGQQKFVARAAELKVDGYLVKPFSQQALTSKVDSILQKWHSPASGFAKARKADRLLAEGNVEGALAEYREAIRASRDSMAVLHYKIGRVHENLSQEAEAEENYQRALNMSRLHVDTYDALGGLAMRQNRCEEAADFYREGVCISPLNADRQYQLGEALLETDQAEEAEQAFRESLKLNPSQSHIFNRLGISLRKQRKLDEAQRYFERALEAAPEDENLYFNAAQVHYLKSDRQAARALLTKALELNPGLEEARELIDQIDAAAPAESRDPAPTSQAEETTENNDASAPSSEKP